jgi:hypothetical protein
MGKHHGIIIGALLILLGGFFGYLLGQQSPSIVTSVIGVSSGQAPVILAILIAGFATLIWVIGEAIAGLLGFAERRIVLLRLTLALVGSVVSVITYSLQLLGFANFNPDPHSIFSYQPIVTGLGSAALGAHALLHQFRLNRELR